ncbi:MAG: ferrous iron transport protein B, partial [Armatimonadetes bacterium]|nr:ferrous iron transport protein B [Armatimonadota bacterium]
MADVPGAPRVPTVALAGNPNSGKTSLFNSLTGSSQRVGNWPGVTVEMREGIRRVESGEKRGARAVHGEQRGKRREGREGDGQIRIVDLPGAYSLAAHSPDERIARDFVLSDESDVVIAVVDAANIERNLYMVLQLIELGKPMVAALNMSDIAEAQGISIDVGKLSQLTGIPVVATCAHIGQGVDSLWDAVMHQLEVRHVPRLLPYGRQVDEAIAEVRGVLAATPELADGLATPWSAISLLLGDDSPAQGASEADPHIQRALSTIRAAARHLQDVTGDTAQAAVINGRYGAIAGIVREAVAFPSTLASPEMAEGRVWFDNPSDRVDRVLLHRIWGLPILIAAVAVTFHLTFTLGAYPSAWIDAGASALATRVSELAGDTPALRHGMLASLIVDGVIGGVGGVLVFLPQVFILFAVIAILEDSGYMARAAFLMDRTMHRMRLHGKAFIPMVMGFGCNVPAIMATRTLESPRDRLVTIMVAPLM